MNARHPQFFCSIVKNRGQLCWSLSVETTIITGQLVTIYREPVEQIGNINFIKQKNAL